MSHYKPYSVYKDSGVEWLGRVPEHWQVKRLKFIASVQTGVAKGKDNVGKDTIEVPYLRVANVQDGYLSLDDVTTIEIPREDLPRYSLRPGDVLMNEGGDFDKVGRGHVWKGEIDPCIHQNHVFAVRPTQIASDWLNAFTSSQAAQFYFMGRAKQSTNLASISSSNVMELPVVVPPGDELPDVLTHLDRETVRIDALIEKKTRFIELLREKRQALITHAVTKGLDPNLKMKDSGVEWLGEVPEHWEVKQLKYVVDPNSSITYGIVQAGPEFVGGVPYIRTSDMSADELPVSGYPLTSPEIDESYARSRVRPGDIVMSIRASVGKCLPVPEGLSVANLTQGTAKVSPGKCITRDFLLAFLNSAAAQVYFDLMAKGATFKEITLDALRRTPVLLPPPAEQGAIDQFISRHIERLDQLGRLSEKSIVMLRERRSALITAAVTGQIDLRESA